MAVLTKLPDLAKSFKAMKLVNEIEKKAIYSNSLFADAIRKAVQDKKSPTLIIKMIKDQAIESPIDVANAIGDDLTNEVLNF